MFETTDYCIDYYVSSRLSNEEHGLIDTSSKDLDRIRIQDYAKKLLKIVNRTLDVRNNESIHPDGWATIANLSDNSNAIERNRLKH